MTLLTEVIEIDLYECMKYDQIRNDGQIRVYLPQPYQPFTYVPLWQTKQRLGNRIWFWCKGCNRRTSKLYLWSSYGYARNSIACRHCLGLKYASQYSPDTVSRRAMNERKLERLKKQERRLWYDGKPTQFGRQFYKLREESKKIREDIHTEICGLVI